MNWSFVDCTLWRGEASMSTPASVAVDFDAVGIAEFGAMEDVDVQKLPRKELLQLCSDRNIRTAGVKHEDLVRLLQKKLHAPASNTPRATPKPRSQIGTDSPISSPKARNQTSVNSPFCSPNAKRKPAERASLPSPGSTSQGRSLRPLLLVDDRSRNNSPEPSTTAPRKEQLSAIPGVQPRKPTTTKSNAPPAQRSDLLRKKVNTLSAIGKLQAQERARPALQGDGPLVRGRNNVASAPAGKQTPETRPQQSDRGASVRNRSGAPATGAPKKNIKSSSSPAKRPGAKSNEASRKGQSATNSEVDGSSPRASEASIAAIAGSHSDLGSHSFNSVSEIAADAKYQVLWENSDADDAHSVSSEPVSRLGSQSERFHPPRTSTGSKLGRDAYPSHGRRSSLDSSVDSNAPLEKISDLLATQGAEILISLCSLEADSAFDLVGGAHGLEINSFLDAHSATPEDINAADVSHKLGQVRNSKISLADFQANAVIAKPEASMKQDAVAETAPSSMQKDESSSPANPRVEHDVAASECRQEHTATIGVESNASVAEEEKDGAMPSGSREHEIRLAISTPEAKDILVASSDAIEGGRGLASRGNVEAEKWFSSTLNLVQNEDSGEEGARMGKNIEFVSERSATNDAPSRQESPVQLGEKNGPSYCSGIDNNVTFTAECIKRAHFNMDSAPLPHADMERSSVTAMSDDRPDPSPSPDSTPGELDICAGKSSSPCDELQQRFDIKLRGAQGVSKFRPKHDYSTDRVKKSNLLQSDRSEKAPLLQDGRENENMQLMRTFPSSILLWCSQLFSAIFGARSHR